MNNEKVLDSQTTKDGDSVVVTRTVEERLTRNDVLARLDSAKRNKEALAAQSQNLKRAYDQYTAQEEELNQMLTLLPADEIATL